MRKMIQSVSVLALATTALVTMMLTGCGDKKQSVATDPSAGQGAAITREVPIEPQRDPVVEQKPTPEPTPVVRKPVVPRQPTQADADAMTAQREAYRPVWWFDGIKREGSIGICAMGEGTSMEEARTRALKLGETSLVVAVNEVIGNEVGGGNADGADIMTDTLVFNARRYRVFVRMSLSFN